MHQEKSLPDGMWCFYGVIGALLICVGVVCLLLSLRQPVEEGEQPVEKKT
jgi:hypothetical protein